MMAAPALPTDRGGRASPSRSRADQTAWEDFFDPRAGPPRRSVADLHGAIERAMLARFAPGEERPPDFHWSDCPSAAS